jgi:hypothetical protein
MNKLIALVSGLALLFQTMPATAASPEPAKTFAQWCQQRNSVPVATKLTITSGRLRQRSTTQKN